MKFRKKPVTIEAQQLDGTEDNALMLRNWVGDGATTYLSDYGWTVDIPIVSRLGVGRVTVHPGDWIIHGVDGEFYPCTSVVFSKAYERVETDYSESTGRPTGRPEAPTSPDGPLPT